MDRAMTNLKLRRPVTICASLLVIGSAVMLGGCQGNDGMKPPPSNPDEATQIKTIESSNLPDSAKQMAIAQVHREHNDAAPASPTQSQ